MSSCLLGRQYKTPHLIWVFVYYSKLTHFVEVGPGVLILNLNLHLFLNLSLSSLQSGGLSTFRIAIELTTLCGKIPDRFFFFVFFYKHWWTLLDANLDQFKVLGWMSKEETFIISNEYIEGILNKCLRRKGKKFFFFLEL